LIKVVVKYFENIILATKIHKKKKIHNMFGANG